MAAVEKVSGRQRKGILILYLNLFIFKNKFISTEYDFKLEDIFISIKLQKQNLPVYRQPEGPR